MIPYHATIPLPKNGTRIKFWIGVAVASIMGLISWFVNNLEKANEIFLVVDIVAVVVIAIFVVLLNNAALREIRELEEI